MGLSSWSILLVTALLSRRVATMNLMTALSTFDMEELKLEIGRNTSLPCSVDLMAYIGALAGFNITGDNQWAFKMLDSTAKIPDGILTGTSVDIGQFDECLAVQYYPTGKFSGKHCMLSINLPLSSQKTDTSHTQRVLDVFNTRRRLPRDEEAANLALSFGVCIPSSCSAADLNWLFNTRLVRAVITASADDANCWTSEPKSFSSGSWGFMSFMIALLVLAAFSTLYEVHELHVQQNDKPSRLVSAFSVYSNTKGLLEVRDSEGEMACLHGMRTLSMMWVLLCHTYIKGLNMPAINLADSLEFMNDLDHIVITNGFFSVDSFFFMSGLLVAFVFFRNIGRNGYYDAPINYIHRYLRLTPSFLIMIVFSITLLDDLNKGPLWHTVMAPEVEGCQQNWWSSLIYLQNYIKPDGICLGQSWYLSADMQMFWISPLILYPLYLWPKYGLVLLGLLTVASTLWTFALAYVHEYNASILIAGTFDQFKYDYIATHARIMPWLVGVALGFAICAIKARRVQVRLPKAAVILGWMFSTGVCLGCLYGYNRFQGDTDATFLDSAFYLSFSRPAWGIGLSWIVFACIYGYGGLVNSFLSMGIFQPLGKLSYNVYLIHMTVLTYRIGVARTNYYIDDWNTVYEFLGTLIISYLFAAVLYLLVEAPIAVIDRQLLSNIKILPYPRPDRTLTSRKMDRAEKGENDSEGLDRISDNTTSTSAESRSPSS